MRKYLVTSRKIASSSNYNREIDIRSDVRSDIANGFSSTVIPLLEGETLEYVGEIALNEALSNGWDAEYYESFSRGQKCCEIEYFYYLD